MSSQEQVSGRQDGGRDGRLRGKMWRNGKELLHCCQGHFPVHVAGARHGLKVPIEFGLERLCCSLRLKVEVDPALEAICSLGHGRCSSIYLYIYVCVSAQAGMQIYVSVCMHVEVYA